MARRTLVALALAPIAFGIADVALFGVVVSPPGGFLGSALAMTNIVKGYAGAAALGIPAHFLLKRRGQSGWLAYTTLGLLLGSVIDLGMLLAVAVFAAPGPPSLLAMLAVTPKLLLATLPSAISGAVGGSVFWGIAQPAPTAEPAVRRAFAWKARAALVVPGLAVLVTWVVPIAERRYEQYKGAHPDPALELAALPHPVWDSQIYPEGRSWFYWVDDDQLLFNGHAAAKPRDAAEGALRTSALYLWRLGEAAQKLGGRSAGSTAWGCARDGWIRYTKQRIDGATGRHIGYFVEGPPGAEQEQAPPPPSSVPIGRQGIWSGDSRWIEPAPRCAPNADPTLAGHQWVSDPDQRYRLDFGRLLPTNHPDPPPVFLMRSGGTERTPLPMTTQQATASCTHAHRFDGAFLVWDCFRISDRERWRANNDCWPIWRVDPRTTDTSKTCLPFGPWRDQVSLIPTKVGLFFTSRSVTSDEPHDMGASGLYALRDGAAQRILVGGITDPVVSPSGCRVAFAYVRDNAAARYGNPGSPTIIVVDLCTAR
jgi:hypothetical protein